MFCPSYLFSPLSAHISPSRPHTCLSISSSILSFTPFYSPSSRVCVCVFPQFCTSRPPAMLFPLSNSLLFHRLLPSSHVFCSSSIHSQRCHLQSPIYFSAPVSSPYFPQHFFFFLLPACKLTFSTLTIFISCPLKLWSCWNSSDALRWRTHK